MKKFLKMLGKVLLGLLITLVEHAAIYAAG